MSHVALDKVYTMTGKDIASMLAIANRLEEGGEMSPIDRRDLGQRLRQLLDRREEFDP